MDGSDRVSGPLWITSEPLVGTAASSSRAKMALFPECRLTCAQNMLDSADIVREGIYRQMNVKMGRPHRQDDPSFRGTRVRSINALPDKLAPPPQAIAPSPALSAFLVRE